MNWLAKAASFSIYAHGLSGNWVALPSAFQLPGTVRVVIFPDADPAALQHVQILEFEATWVDQRARTPPQWPSRPFQVEKSTFDGDRFSLTGDDIVLRFHIDKIKPITVYSSDAEVASLAQLLSQPNHTMQGFPVTARVLAPDVWVDQMDSALEAPPQEHPFRPQRQHPIHPKYVALISLGIGFLLAAVGWHLATGSGAIGGINAWLVVFAGCVLIARGALELLFERW